MRFKKVIKKEVIETRNLNNYDNHAPKIINKQENIPLVKAQEIIEIKEEKNKDIIEIEDKISIILDKLKQIESRLIKLESVNYVAQIEENNLLNSEQLFKINQKLNNALELDKVVKDTQIKFENIVLNLKNEIDELKTKI